MQSSFSNLSARSSTGSINSRWVAKNFYVRAAVRVRVTLRQPCWQDTLSFGRVCAREGNQRAARAMISETSPWPTRSAEKASPSSAQFTARVFVFLASAKK
jgi:hypothetical protein